MRVDGSMDMAAIFFNAYFFSIKFQRIVDRQLTNRLIGPRNVLLQFKKYKVIAILMVTEDKTKEC